MLHPWGEDKWSFRQSFSSWSYKQWDFFFPWCFLHVESLLSLSDLLLSSSMQFHVCWSQTCWQVQEEDSVCSSPASPIHQSHLEASVSFSRMDLAIVELLFWPLNSFISSISVFHPGVECMSLLFKVSVRNYQLDGRKQVGNTLMQLESQACPGTEVRKNQWG